MKSIDRETIQKIIDTADIVEVVSDFVSLRRRGANYIGLCPFHNERTPSFSVSRAKGICKCFSCGKGGSPVNFIMEHEQMTYWEALRYLAKKYNIEIQEHEVSDEERRQMNERQSMMEANDFAIQHFEHNLTQTDDGRDIGLAYFRERGINDWAISRFHLGYSLDKRDDLLSAAKKAGINEKYLIETGLCVKNDRGAIYDRFKARVMYPVFTISGKVVAFGGRTLRSDKEVAKYVNSPESSIYSKSRELYGLYQAKQAIVKKDKCILVEGYMDVISMHQQGVENVVASSGTSLTQGQIRLIHRFTENVTVIYDSDPAGIKASLRGIDLLLAEGLNIKVLLLPDGDDPDSFAQSHTAEQVEQYLKENEVDFIRFKTDILLKDAANDPIQRSKVLSSILSSISRIPTELVRAVYIKECAQRFGIDEAVMARQVNLEIAKHLEEEANRNRRAEAVDSIEHGPGVETAQPAEITSDGHHGTELTPDGRSNTELTADGHLSKVIEPQERALLRLLIKFGMLPLSKQFGTDHNNQALAVIDYVKEDLDVDNITFANPIYRKTYDEMLRLRCEEYDADFEAAAAAALQRKKQATKDGIDQLRLTATNTADITKGEAALHKEVQDTYEQELIDFNANFFRNALLSHPDDQIRRIATELTTDRHQLSRIFTKEGTSFVPEEKRIDDLVPRALIALKYDMARCFADQLRQQILHLQQQPQGYDIDEVFELMKQQVSWQNFCNQLATRLGERVYEPLR